jgi:hypothetical protein
MKNYSSVISCIEPKKQYLLCFIKYCLETWDNTTFSSGEIAALSDGLATSNAVTIALKRLSLSYSHTSERLKGSQPKSKRVFRTKKVLNVLQKYALQSFDLSQLKIAFNSKSRTRATNNTISSVDFNGGVSSKNSSVVPTEVLLDFVFPHYTPEDVASYHADTSFNYHYYYELSHALKNILEVDLETKCLNVPKDFPRDKSHYPLLTPKLIKHLNKPFDISLFRTRQLSRIITQTFNPLIDYDGIEGHHTCKIRGEENRSCCNPAHLTPATKSKHIAFHNRVGDDHAHNDPTQTFQIVETKKLKQPIKPNNNPVPYYAINRHSGVKFNRKLILEMEDGEIIKATDLHPSVIEEYEQGFNYKGK